MHVIFSARAESQFLAAGTELPNPILIGAYFLQKPGDAKSSLKKDLVAQKVMIF
jgi:hypothetical protein